MSIRNRINRFVKQQRKMARRRYIERMGFLAQSQDESPSLSSRTLRKGCKIRNARASKDSGGRGMNGVMR